VALVPHNLTFPQTGLRFFILALPDLKLGGMAANDFQHVSLDRPLIYDLGSNGLLVGAEQLRSGTSFAASYMPPVEPYVSVFPEPTAFAQSCCALLVLIVLLRAAQRKMPERISK